LAAGLIRAVGDPATRFDEDALRMLRAVRFACRMSFAVEEKTHEALVAAAPGLAEAAKAQLKEVFDHVSFELLPLTPVFTPQGGPGCVAIQAIKEL
jgi:tRNA nucleotidyltransferase (CCA-adding enzyme)